MTLSYHSEVTDGRYKAQFRLFVQIIRNLSERKSQRRIQENYVFEQTGERWGSLKDSEHDYLWGRKRVFWGQKEFILPALKEGMQAYDLCVQMTNCDWGKQEKQENISSNGSLGGPEISSVEAHGWHICQE